MKKLTKKNILIAIAIVFIGFFNVSYGEESNVCQKQETLLSKLEANEQKVLFTFMEDYEFLRMVAAICEDKQPIAFSGLKTKLNSHFSEQFLAELDTLKQNNPHVARNLMQVFHGWLYPRSAKEEIPYMDWKRLVEGDFYDFCKVITSNYYGSLTLSSVLLRPIRTSETLLHLLENNNLNSLIGYWIGQNIFFDYVKKDVIKTDTLVKEFYDVFEDIVIDNYPTTVNLINCLNAFLRDLNKLREIVNQNLTDDQSMKLIGLIFADISTKYEKFIDANRTVLEKIEQLINEEFNNDPKKKCIQFKDKDFCI